MKKAASLPSAGPREAAVDLGPCGFAVARLFGLALRVARFSGTGGSGKTAAPPFPGPYQISLAANCNCRADPKSPFGKRVLVITPNVPGTTGLNERFGLPKFG